MSKTEAPLFTPGDPLPTLVVIDRENVILGRLLPVTCSEPDLESVAALMTEWRNRNGGYFLSQFTATVPRTLDWLRSIVTPDSSRALFMVVTTDGAMVGHLGVLALGTEVVELDNMLRGVRQGPPALMYWSEVAVLRWLFGSCGAESAYLRVLTNNWIPIGIHQSIGFEVIASDPVWKVEKADGIQLATSGDEGDLQKFRLATMQLTAQAFWNSELGRQSVENHVAK